MHPIQEERFEVTYRIADFQIALQAEDFADHVRLARPPWWLQHAVFAVLRPIAHLLGYQAWERPA